MLLTLGRLAWTEIAGWSRRSSLYVVLSGLILLVLISAAVGAGDLIDRRQAYADQLTGIAREQVRPLLPMTGTVMERVLRVPRPPELGSIMARGDDVRLSPYFDFGPWGILWGQSVVADTAQMQAGGLFDIESILRVIGGLIAMLLGVEVVGSSRFRGQLRAWHALGLSPVIAVTGKLLGCAAILTGATCAVFFAVFVAVGFRFPDEYADLLSILWASLVPVALYLSVLACLGAAAALWSRTLNSAAVAGVAMWATAAMLGPQVGAVAGRLLVPAPQRAEFETAREQSFRADVRATEEAIGQALEPSLPALPVQINGDMVADAVNANLEKLESTWAMHVRSNRESVRQADAKWLTAWNHQARVSASLVLATPGASLIGAVSALAGTGGDLSRSWYAKVESHQQQLNEALFDNRPRANFRVRGTIDGFRRHQPLRWSDLPAPPATVVSWRWREAAAPLMGLLGYLIVAGVFVVTGARRATSQS